MMRAPKYTDEELIQRVWDVEEVKKLCAKRCYYIANDWRQKELDELWVTGEEAKKTGAATVRANRTEKNRLNVFFIALSFFRIVVFYPFTRYRSIFQECFFRRIFPSGRSPTRTGATRSASFSLTAFRSSE